jgi:hypothetical protein
MVLMALLSFSLLLISFHSFIAEKKGRHPMKDKQYYHRFASQLLRALLITGTGSAVTLLLHLHFDFSPQLTDEQYLAELQVIMNAYYAELDRLDILAAATQPEFSGLRTLIKRVVEERLEKE